MEERIFSVRESGLAGGSDDVIGAALFRYKGGDSFAKGIRGHTDRLNQGLLGIPIPITTTELVFPEDVDPFVVIEGNLNLFICQSLTVPI